MIVYSLAILGFAAAFIMNSIYHMHMFQLNSYKHREHYAWLKGKKRELAGVYIWYMLAACLFAAGLIGKAAGAVLLLGVAWFQRPKKAKKPLVYTKRVQRMCITIGILFLVICIMLVCLRDYSLVLPLTVLWVLLLSPLGILLADTINKPVETAINRWYIEDARKIMKSMPDMKVIGITGSYGKTSVKFYLQKILSAKYDVLITPENYNTTLGVVKTIRTNLKATHEVFVCEMGAKNVGDIKEICDLVEPGHGVITSVGPQHLESFLTLENVINTKFELADAVPENGMVFLNYDNEYIRNKRVDKKTVTYGVEEPTAQYRPYDIQMTQNGSSFKMKLDGEERKFTTKLIGMHNIVNIAGAIAVAHKLEVPVDAIVNQVRKLEGVTHRLQLRKGGQALIIDDAYNSNPSGAKAALDTLAMFDGAKIIVTPGMVELGSRQYECNRIFGEQIAAVCDYTVLVGPNQTKPIQDGLRQAGYPADQLFVAANLEEGLNRVYSFNSQGRQKIVLLENDLPDNYES